MKKSLSAVFIISCAGMIVSLLITAAWMSIDSGTDVPFPPVRYAGTCAAYLWSAGSLPYDIPVMMPVSILFLWLTVLSLWMLVIRKSPRVFEYTFLATSLLVMISGASATVAMFISRTACVYVIAVCVLSIASAAIAVRRYARLRKGISSSRDGDSPDERSYAASMVFCAFFLVVAALSLYSGAGSWMRLQTVKSDLLRERVISLIKTGREISVFPESIISRGGGRDAKVVFSVFSDPFCPACLSFYEKENEIISRYGKLVRFDHYFLPLDKKCNRAVKGSGHPYSCETVSYEYAAAKTGIHELFMKNHTRRLAEIKNMFRKKASQEEFSEMYTGKRGNASFIGASRSDACAEYIRRDIEFAHKHRISRTPTVFVQGRRMTSPLSEEVLAASVDGFLNSP